jgi:hypothetical protein
LRRAFACVRRSTDLMLQLLGEDRRADVERATRTFEQKAVETSLDRARRARVGVRKRSRCPRLTLPRAALRAAELLPHGHQQPAGIHDAEAAGARAGCNNSHEHTRSACRRLGGEDAAAAGPRAQPAAGGSRAGPWPLLARRIARGCASARLRTQED